MKRKGMKGKRMVWKRRRIHSPHLHFKIEGEQIKLKIEPKEHPFSFIHLLKNSK
jgi:hypothetical protein